MISNAIMKPRIVTIRAVSFTCKGMVIKGVVTGGILLERMNQAKMLPISRRLIGLISMGLVSLMLMRGEKRGCSNRVKKMMRVL